MAIRLIGKRILVLQKEKEKVTESGIQLAHDEFSRNEACKGTVKAVSDAVPTIREGDTVIFEEFSGAKVSIDGVDYIIMSETDVIGIE